MVEPGELMAVRACTIRRRLSEGARSAILSGDADGEPVIIKSLKDPFPAPRDRAALEREFRLLSKLASAGLNSVIPPLALQEVEGRASIIMKDLGGRPLNELIASGELSMEQRLDLALGLALAVGEVHEHGVVHKDIKPDNVVVDGEGRAWLIDFGISSELGSEQHQAVAPGRIQGTLAYLSPEQTGRMNRSVDYRSDFYSLGCTLYELFSGRRPFDGPDALSLLHAHLARTPVAPHDINPAVPQAISAVVLRLMNKLAEDRYQTASGLAADLRTCLSRFAKGRTDAFELGTSDRSPRFAVPRRLYGRTDAIAALLEAFDALGAGQSKLLFVSGWSGVGKSALIAEIHRPVVARRGYFLRGKFDQYRRKVPYSALIQAFDGLLAQLLTEDEERLTASRARLKAALGDVGGVIAQVLPSIELLLGPQSDPPSLSGDAVRHRFERVFTELVGALARPENPLVLFLDDLQWADQPSLDLLKVLLTDASIGNLLVLGAFRDNEVSDSHPLSLLRGELRSVWADAGHPPESVVHLQGLTVRDLTALLGDTLGSSPEATTELAKLLHRKTLGNPFFVGEFLEDLHRRGLIQFDPRGPWTWELEAIARTQITDNVVELVTGRIAKLDTAVREPLRLGAALGSVFDLQTLAIVAGQGRKELADALWPALKAGLLIPLDDTYRLVSGEESDQLNPRYAFQHDRVQQAAYSLTPDGNRKATHLAIGRALLAAGRGQSDLFSVVDQLQHGLTLVTDPDERLTIAQLFGDAGERARQASAVGPSIGYLRSAIRLLGDKPWDAHYELMQPLMSQLAEGLYLEGDLEDAEAVITELLERSRSNLEKARIHLTRIGVYGNRGQFVEAVQDAIIALRLCGEKLPRDPGMPGMIWELTKVKLALRGTKLAEIADFPSAEDELKIEAIRILSGIAGPGTFLSIELGSTIILRMCLLSARYGNCGPSTFAWALYGMIAGPILGDFAATAELLEVSRKLEVAYPDIASHSKVKGAQGGMLAHWGAHPSASIPDLEASFKSGLEAGDPLHAHYASCQSMYARMVQGDKLALVEELAGRYLDYARRNHMQESPETLVAELAMVAALRGETRSRDDWSDDSFDEAEWVAMVTGYSMKLPLHLYSCLKAQTSYIFGDFERTLEMVALSKTVEATAAGLQYRTLQNFFDGLALCALWDGKDAAWQRSARKGIKAAHKKLTLWAKHAPDGFLHKRLMLESEIARIDGDRDRAATLIDQAIDEVTRQPQFFQNRAIANEIGARLHQAAGRARVAEVYIRAARDAYSQWGASAKVAELDEAYPQLSFGKGRGSGLATHLTLAGTADSDATAALDLSTVIKATEAIAGEIVFGKLLERLLSLATENAGARRALLILEDASGPAVRAEQSPDGGTRVDIAEPLSSRSDLSAAVVQSVRRTRTPVIVEDASAPSRFASCPWISGGNTRTVLALPLVRGADLSGVLYLENDLTSGVFTQERLELLGLLSSQMAIAIENARLYSDLEGFAKAYSRFVPTEFLSALGIEDVRDVSLGDAVQKEMTVLFSDIRDFAAMSERMSPEENFKLLNMYLNRVGPVIRENGGFIDKYLGDGVMALFPNHPDDAIAAALAMHRALRELNVTLVADGVTPLRIGVGIHHGSLVLGTIGEEQRFDGTVISDVVNVAARLEGLTKNLGASILLSGETLALTSAGRESRCTRSLGSVRLRGRSDPLSVFEIYEGDPAERRERLDATKAQVERAMELIADGDMEGARGQLDAVLTADPADAAVAYYLAQTESFSSAEGLELSQSLVIPTL